MALSKMPSVSLTLNVPGFPKSNTITERFFSICLKDLIFFLQANRIQVNKENSIRQTDMRNL
jgi:phosphoribosyl-dephospho-CoA transferase